MEDVGMEGAERDPKDPAHDVREDEGTLLLGRLYSFA